VQSYLREELVDLANLIDKYQLGDAVRISIELKKWVEPYQKVHILCPANTYPPDFSIITFVFNMGSDFEYLVNRLTMEVRVDGSGSHYYEDKSSKKVLLHSGLPTCISSIFII
jgi:hypothetical protein